MKLKQICGFTISHALAVVIVTAGMLFASVADSSAQIVKRGVQGGLLGAGVGALVGGGKGAGKGAAIGAAIGAVVGVAEKDGRRGSPPPNAGRPPGPPPGPGPGHGSGLVIDIQSSLTRLGYQPGPVDGQYGRRTADAIRAYEYNNQLPLTGQPSPQLYNHMVQHGG